MSYERCPKCDSDQCTWVGRSRYYDRLKKVALDVMRCGVCFHTWRYSQWGKAVTVRRFTLFLGKLV